MRNLRLSGDTDGVNAIRAELGLGQGSRGGNRSGDGIRKGNMRGQNAGGNFVDANGDGVCDQVQ